MKVDVDANPGLSATFNVSGIPAVKAFRDGRVVSEFVGALSPTAISAFLDGVLAPPRADVLLEELRASGELPEVVAALDRTTSTAHSPGSSLQSPPRATTPGTGCARSRSLSSTGSGRTIPSPWATAGAWRRRSTSSAELAEHEVVPPGACGRCPPGYGAGAAGTLASYRPTHHAVRSM